MVGDMATVRGGTAPGAGMADTTAPAHSGARGQTSGARFQGS